MTPSKIQLRTFGYRQSALFESGTISVNLFVPSRLYLSLRHIDKYLISLSFLLMTASHKSFGIAISIKLTTEVELILLISTVGEIHLVQ